MTGACEIGGYQPGRWARARSNYRLPSTRVTGLGRRMDAVRSSRAPTSSTACQGWDDLTASPAAATRDRHQLVVMSSAFICARVASRTAYSASSTAANANSIAASASASAMSASS